MRLLSLGAFFLLGSNIALLPSFAQDCVFYESCSDNVIDSKWLTSATNSSVLGCIEENGRLEFPAFSENTGGEYFAGIISNGWKVNMLENWMVSIRYNLGFNSPSYGDTGLGFILAFDIDPLQPTLFTGYTLSGGTENFGFSESPYEAARFWQSGVSTIQSLAYRSYIQSTVYVWYDADLDCISHSDVPGIPASTVCGVRSLSSETVASLGMFGFSFGVVPSSPGSQSWGDDFCLMYGELVGPLVGACCMEDGCSQTLLGDCSGVWFGKGSTCDDAAVQCSTCEGDLTSDDQVDGADITVLLNDWGSASGDSDLNDDGVVGGADLTILLSSWGACGG